MNIVEKYDTMSYWINQAYKANPNLMLVGNRKKLIAKVKEVSKISFYEPSLDRAIRMVNRARKLSGMFHDKESDLLEEQHREYFATK